MVIVVWLWCVKVVVCYGGGGGMVMMVVWWWCGYGGDVVVWLW